MAPGRIKDSDLEAVRERTDIAGLISEYVPLKKAGREFRGPCPFHKEKDPSFYVNQQKGVYHCYGCNASGNAITFLMEHDSLTFGEAVERLADRLGMRLERVAASPEEAKKRDLKDRLFRLNTAAAEFFRHQLLETPQGKPALDYLSGRGIDREVIDDFKIGYAPDSWDALSVFLNKKGFGNVDIVDAGLAGERSREGGRPGLFDFFRNRVMFTVIDHMGRVVAFSGRVMPASDDTRKYINTKETPVYHKGSVLTGYYQSRAAIQDMREAVMVEGFTDLLALWRAGLKNVVAPLGTAITEHHFELLSRSADRIYLAFDSDRAGMDAAARALELFSRFKLEVFVVRLPEGQDPASMVESGEADSFRDAIEEAEQLFEFACERTIARNDISTPMGRRRAMEACMPVLQKVSGDDMKPVLNDLVRKLSGWLDMPQETVKFFLTEAKRPEARTSSRREERRATGMWDKVEREALELLLQDAGAFADHQYLDADYFTNPLYKTIIEMLKDMPFGAEYIEQAEHENLIGRLIGDVGDPSLRAAVTRLFMDPLPRSEPGYEEKVFDSLSRRFFEGKKRQAELEIGKVDKKREPKKYEALCDRLFELNQIIKEQYPFDHR